MLLPAALAALLLAGKGEASCNAHYTVVSGDSCSSIASSKHTYFAEILALNPTTINSTCSNLVVGQSVCWRDSTDPTCTTKSAVPSGGSCSSMAASHGTTSAQILGLNPYLNSDCSNLYAGDYICVSGTVPGTATTTVSSTTTTASSTPTVACAKPYTVKSGDTCSTIESANSVTDTVLRSLNPAINSACSNLAGGQVLCLQASTATTTTASSTATPSGCAKAYTVKSSDTCSAIETANSISDSLLHSLNPAINFACSNLVIGQALCIQATPTSTTTSSSTATPSGCSKTYTVKSGDTCSSIEAANSISDSLLHSLNPSVNAACSNLAIGQILCIQSSLASTTTATATITTATPTAAPSITGCAYPYVVKANDTCASVELLTGITDTEFHALNPSINVNCTNLMIGQAICLASNQTATQPPCYKWYTAVSGNSCGSI